MKRLLLLFLVILITTGITSAQSPDMFNYQAVARDDQGNVLSNQDVGIKISILQGSASGTVVYAEEHTKTTNEQGLVNLMIGDGSVLSGTFSNIDWSSGPYFVKVGLDETGGTSYSTMGTSQLLSVPYAKYAESSANAFSGNYNDLMNTPDFTDWDQNVNDDFSGDYNDLMNTPDFTDWDQNVNDDFSGDYTDLANTPDHGQYVDTTMTLDWDKDTTDDFSGDYSDLNNKLWMSMSDTVYYNNGRIGLGTDSVTSAITMQGMGEIKDVTLRDNYSFMDLNATQGNSGLYLSYHNDVKGNIWYYQGGDNLIISRTEYIDNDFVIDANSNIGINESFPAEQLDVNGAVRVQDTTVNPEPKRIYGNSTPIAYGEIDTDGSIHTGAYGIESVNKVATGEYEITLRNGFSENASVSVTTWDDSSPEIATYEHFGDTDKITVHIWNMSSSKIDSDFSIVVYGLPEGAKKKKKKSETKINTNRISGSPD